jgi:hypothetical protein
MEKSAKILKRCEQSLMEGWSKGQAIASNAKHIHLQPLIYPVDPMKTFITPLMSVRPRELLSDGSTFTLPFMSHTNACINFVKRKIRTSIMNNDKKNGIISFSINPSDSWFLNIEKVDIPTVITEINEWLSKSSSKHDTTWPKRIVWRDMDPFRSKVTHGNHFIVNYWSYPDYGNHIM